MFDFTDAHIYLSTKEVIKVKPEIIPTKEGHLITVKAEDIPQNAEYLDLFPDMPVGKAGDDGYFVTPFQYSDFICEYKEGEDLEKFYHLRSMPIYGFKKCDKAALVVVKSLAWEYRNIIRRQNNTYYIFPRFDLTGYGERADIVIEYFYLSGEDANYVGMAKRYRKYQKDRGAFKTLTEKCEKRPDAKGVFDSVNIRIRMGWKPVPALIGEQTIQNEPPMKVAVTFERLIDIIDEMMRQGIKKADICLVGWNQKGHDGRFPQMFPVEESLGGEEKLRLAIKKAQDAGYTINAHTNSSDAYSIADSFSKDDMIINSDGTVAKGNFLWAGGVPYFLCPECAYEIALKDLKKVQELGFYGMHYIDVLGTVPPRHCFSKKHPLTANQGGKYWEKTLEYAKNLFGGVSSEGGYDYLIGVLDYGLYIANNILDDATDPFINIKIPLYQLVYHGTVLYCPSGDTINCTMGDKKKILKVVEYGGRPAMYFYQKFMDMDRGGFDFLGSHNPMCDDDEQLKISVRAVKDAEELYNALEPIRYQAMVNHEKLAEGIYKTTYEQGNYTLVNYTDKDYTFHNHTVKAEDWIIV